MQVNNNFNNNQINFKADLKVLDNIIEKELTLRLVKIAKDAKGAKGVVVMREHVKPCAFNKGAKSYITEFDYFQKNKAEAISSDKEFIGFDSLDGLSFNMWEKGVEKSNTRSLSKEEKDNKIVEFFQKFMDSMSKK